MALPGGWCNSCGKILTLDNSYQYEMLSGKKQIKKTYMSNVCRPCKTEHAKNRYNLAKIHSWPLDSECMCCGRIDKLHLDHCHNSEKYRGFTSKIATWDSDTWATVSKAWNAH